MIDSLHVTNFKCFEELSLPLKPLTLLTGFNAAGKSTTLQAILLLAQAMREGGRYPLIALNGDLVRLGSPGDVIRQGGQSDLQIGFQTGQWRIDWFLSAEDRRTGYALPVKRIRCQSGLDVNERHVLPEEGLEYLLPRNASTEFIDLVESLKTIVFLSAVRAGSIEAFPAPDAPAPVWADVGWQGQYATWWFEKCMDEDVDIARRHPEEGAPSLRKQFNAWASNFFPGAEANAQKIVGTSLVRLELRNHGSDEWRRPANIGYGLTYALPILVAGLIAKPGQILMVDSPEAHLHPMGQSEMGRFLAMLAHSGVQVVIETHSDHVLNGVRLAVRRGQLSPNDAAIHFFNSRPRTVAEPAHITSMKIDVEGGLSEWPHGFFDQAERDLAALAGWE